MTSEDDEPDFYDAGEDSAENGWDMHIGNATPGHIAHQQLPAGHGATLHVGTYPATRRPRPRPRLVHSQFSSSNHSPSETDNSFAKRADFLNGGVHPHAGHGGESTFHDHGQNNRTSTQQQLRKYPSHLLNIPRKYAVAYDILYADRVPETEISIVKIAREVIGGIKHGADVTNVNLPASVLDPVSSLEKGMKSMQRGELIQVIVRERDPYNRFLGILKFYFSGLSKEKFGKKPYNPILGEIFRACYIHRGSGGHTVLIAEQTSHHPPISALHLCNDTLGFYMNSHAAPEPRFWGNSVEVKLKGIIRIVLEKFNGEEYELTRPSIYMSGFLAGRHRLEYVGQTAIRSIATGLGADIVFKARGVLGRGELNGVSGRIFELDSGRTLSTLSGTWDGIIELKEELSGRSSVLFDYDHVVKEYSMCAVLPPPSEREPTFSSVVWAECSKWIWKSDTLNANAAKRTVEEEQRRLQKEREAAGKDWMYHYFEPRKDGKEGFIIRDDIRGLSEPEIALAPEDADIIAKTQRFADPESSLSNGDLSHTNSGRASRRKLVGLVRSKKGVA